MPQPTPPTSGSNPTFTIQTSAGTITGQLFPNEAPVTVANFVKYAKEGFYKGLIFHRVIKGFVIQGGGLEPSGRQRKPSHASIRLEISPALTHWDGALSMARTSDPNSATTQFYVCDGPQASLDKNYAVFGLVTGGLDVVKRIATKPTDRSDQPRDPVTIKSITVKGA